MGTVRSSRNRAGWARVSGEPTECGNGIAPVARRRCCATIISHMIRRRGKRSSGIGTFMRPLRRGSQSGKSRRASRSSSQATKAFGFDAIQHDQSSPKLAFLRRADPERIHASVGAFRSASASVQTLFSADADLRSQDGHRYAPTGGLRICAAFLRLERAV